MKYGKRRTPLRIHAQEAVPECARGNGLHAQASRTYLPMDFVQAIRSEIEQPIWVNLNSAIRSLRKLVGEVRPVAFHGPRFGIEQQRPNRGATNVQRDDVV